jgi:hypothetical protein
MTGLRDDEDIIILPTTRTTRWTPGALWLPGARTEGHAPALLVSPFRSPAVDQRWRRLVHAFAEWPRMRG